MHNPFGMALLSNQFNNTQLSPQQESGFQQWAPMNIPVLDQLRAMVGTSDYDYRGFYNNPMSQKGINPNDGQMHFTDWYKKPQHPTFSNESFYGFKGNPGQWAGNSYLPNPAYEILNAHWNRKPSTGFALTPDPLQRPL